MRDALTWGPLYGRCGRCERLAEFAVDADSHPHLNGQVGVRCPRCNKYSIYLFAATVDDELASQAKAKQQLDAESSGPPAVSSPEEWACFQAAMFGLMPQPPAPPDFAPTPDTLFRWRLLQAEGRGPLDHPEEDHEQ